MNFVLSIMIVKKYDMFIENVVLNAIVMSNVYNALQLTSIRLI